MDANAYLKTNSIDAGTTAPLIVGATLFSLVFMFIFIWLGLPTWLTVALFVIIIYLAIYSFVYTAQYWIYNDRIVEDLQPKLSFMPFIRAKQNTYAWADLESYLQDVTLTRYYGERAYLKLYFKNPKRLVHINEGNEAIEKENFAQFLLAFTALIDGDAPQNQTTASTQPAQNQSVRQNETTEAAAVPTQPERAAIANASVVKPIKARAKKSFYNGVGGKILAIVFLVLTATLVGMHFFPDSFGGIKIKGTASWRLWVVILPGTMYLVGRAFFSKKK